MKRRSLLAMMGMAPAAAVVQNIPSASVALAEISEPAVACNGTVLTADMIVKEALKCLDAEYRYDLINDALIHNPYIEKVWERAADRQQLVNAPN